MNTFFRVFAFGISVVTLAYAQSPPQPISPKIIPRFAYVPDRSTNNVNAFAIDPASGALTSVPGSPFATGSGPTSVAVDPRGRFLYVGDLGSFQVSAYRINPTTGALSEISGSPFAAGDNPQAIAVSPSGNFLYVLDTFSAPQNGQIEVFSIDSSTGAIAQISGSPFPAGTVPGSIAFTNQGQFAYVTDVAANQVLGYAVDTTTGALTTLGGSPYPADEFPVSVAVDGLTRSVYVVNESNDISAFHITASGDLRAIPGSPFPSGGTIPLSIAVDAQHRFAYVDNDISANLTVFRINPYDGALHQIAGSFTTGSAPTTVIVDPSHKFVYAVNSGSEDISAYTINPSTGALTEISGSPFPVDGIEPSSIAITRGLSH